MNLRLFLILTPVYILYILHPCILQIHLTIFLFSFSTLWIIKFLLLITHISLFLIHNSTLSLYYTSNRKTWLTVNLNIVFISHYVSLYFNHIFITSFPITQFFFLMNCSYLPMLIWKLLHSLNIFFELISVC
jgi:hypothetical protein